MSANHVVQTDTGTVVGGIRAGRGRWKTLAEHEVDCACGVCDEAPRPCPEPGCWAVGESAPKGIKRLGIHVYWTHTARSRSFTRVLVPDGLGFLRGVLRDPRRRAGLHLEAFPRFTQWLCHQAQRKPKARGKAGRAQLDGTIAAAQAVAQADPGAPYDLPGANLAVPASLAVVICQLSRESGVAVRHVATALLCYGVELLAKEVREKNAVPYPRVPYTELVQK